MVLMLIGPGSAILARDVIGILGVALAFGFALLDHGLRDRRRVRCHINPAVTLAFVVSGKLPSPGRSTTGWRRSPAPSSVVCSSSSSPRAADLDETGGIFAANGWGDKIGSPFGLGSVIVVEIVFTALLIFVVLSTTTSVSRPGSVASPPGSRWHDPPRHDPGRQHVGEPGPEHRDRGLLR